MAHPVLYSALFVVYIILHDNMHLILVSIHSKGVKQSSVYCYVIHSSSLHMKYAFYMSCFYMTIGKQMKTSLYCLNEN